MNILWRLIGYSWRYKWSLMGAYGAMIGATASMLAIPWLLGTAIDEIVNDGLRSQIRLTAGAVALVSVLGGLLTYGQSYLSDSVSYLVARDLPNDLFRKFQNLSFGFHDHQRTGNLMSIAGSDVEQVQQFTGFGLIKGLSVFTMIGAVIALVLVTHLRLGLIGMAFVLPVLWRSWVMIPRMHDLWMKVQAEMGVLSTIVQENLTGMRVVKAFGAREHETSKFEPRASAIEKFSYSAIRMNHVRANLAVLMYGVCTAAVIYFGVRDVVAGRVTAGELAALILYMGLIREPTQRSGFLVSVFTNAAGAGKRIFGVLDAKSPVIERPKASPLPRVGGDVKFDNVSAGYGPGGEVVHDLCFDARAGQLVALLGAPGSGKSTIAHLLPRFYEVSAGRITIDGNDVRDVTLDSLRKNVGIVLQDSFAFSATIRDNIAYGRDDASMDEIVRAAKVAQLHDFIMSLPDGYDTWVGERGITLSGGQRQRLAIARTVLLDPPIIILDDSTSSVDVSTELQIQKALAEVVKGRTTFVITHRLTTVRNADLILVLDQGEIVERGTRSELLSRDGYYKSVYDLQISSQDVDTLFQMDAPTFELQPADDPTGEAEKRPASSYETALDDEMKYPAYFVREVMARLLGYSRPYNRLLMVVIVCMLAWIGMGAAWPWIIKLALDGYAVGGDGERYPQKVCKQSGGVPSL